MKDLPAHLLSIVRRLQTEPMAPHADARVEEKRRTHRRAYLPWSEEETALLLELQAEDWSEADLSVLLQRQRSAVRTRLERLLTPSEAGRPDAPERAVQATTAPRLAQPTVTRITADLVAPHFPAWLALVRTGGVIQIVEGDEVVAVLSPPGHGASEQTG